MGHQTLETPCRDGKVAFRTVRPPKPFPRISLENEKEGKIRPNQHMQTNYLAQSSRR
jgi:hypothetical protein